LPGGKVEDSHAENTVEVVIDLADCRFELLPQNLLFLLRNFFLRNLLRVGRHWGPGRSGEQSEEEKSFQHGDLRVSGIIRPNRWEQRKSPACKFDQQPASRVELRQARCDGDYLVCNANFLAMEVGSL